MDSNGAWTRIMNRIDDSIFFDKKFSEYKDGFGKIVENCWIGLNNLRTLVLQNNQKMSLRIQLLNSTSRSFIEYERFFIDTEENGYELTVEKKIAGDLPDSFSFHTGSKFSTVDMNQGKSAAYYDFCLK